eukprot:TRINITY_DN40486_c0_g1_i1.p1 TRINITY_DN40486_c0_g1~~TRINITY_DN40486_c0_g1_i1.p1  ORF type:complete len:136 (-),score=45.96 TRINITY_DN40486_c0_g1_i1:376-783(-)
MGRGRGKGKKMNAVSATEERTSEEDGKIPSQKKRKGRSVRGSKKEPEGFEEVEEEIDVKGVMNKKIGSKAQSGNKRKRQKQNEISEGLELGSNHSVGVLKSSSADDLLKPSTFISYISRRKSKPRRAAEAGVECK